MCVCVCRKFFQNHTKMFTVLISGWWSYESFYVQHGNFMDLQYFVTTNKLTSEGYKGLECHQWNAINIYFLSEALNFIISIPNYLSEVWAASQPTRAHSNIWCVTRKKNIAQCNRAKPGEVINMEQILKRAAATEWNVFLSGEKGVSYSTVSLLFKIYF